MDNVTHTLVGVALSQAGLNRKTRFATLALVIGSNLPDIDVIWAPWGGGASYLECHRGVTHSFLGIAALGALLAAGIYALGRRAQPAPKSPPLNLRWLLVICWIATATHLLMDFTNAYGVRPLLPFSGRWYAWDIMPIVDPVLLVLLAAGLGLPMLFRLVSEEVGARKPGFRRGAIFALVAMVAWWGFRDLSHRRLLGFLDSHTYGQEAPLRTGVFPGFGPLDWTGVVETDSAFHVLAANPLDSDVDADHTEVFYKPKPSAALDAALRTRTGRVFSDFARFLWAHVEENPDGFDVTLRDLRFASVRESRHAFECEIELGKDLSVRSETFGFTGAPAAHDD